jgi:hypothetical protein
LRNYLKILAFIVVNCNLIYGNGGPPPPPPFVSTEVSGPLHQTPLFLADTNSVTIFAQFSVLSPSSIEGLASIEGTYDVNSSLYGQKNLNWEISSTALSFGINIRTWKTLALFATLNFGERDGGMLATGSDFGIGLLMGPDKNFRARIDLGLTYLSMDMKTKLLSSASPDTIYTIVTNNQKGLDPLVSLTLQTAFEDWLINPFFQASYCRQTPFNISGYSRDIYSTIILFTFTPGITFRLDRNILIIAGGKYFIPSDLENRSSNALYSGFLQANFLF